MNKVFKILNYLCAFPVATPTKMSSFPPKEIGTIVGSFTTDPLDVRLSSPSPNWPLPLDPQLNISPREVNAKACDDLQLRKQNTVHQHMSNRVNFIYYPAAICVMKRPTMPSTRSAELLFSIPILPVVSPTPQLYT